MYNKQKFHFIRSDCQYYEEHVVQIWGLEIDKYNFENAGYKHETLGISLRSYTLYEYIIQSLTLYFSSNPLEIKTTCSSQYWQSALIKWNFWLLYFCDYTLGRGGRGGMAEFFYSSDYTGNYVYFAGTTLRLSSCIW